MEELGDGQDQEEGHESEGEVEEDPCTQAPMLIIGLNPAVQTVQFVSGFETQVLKMLTNLLVAVIQFKKPHPQKRWRLRMSHDCTTFSLHVHACATV